jgi:uncharacterized protein YbaP (TraB family)
LVLSAAEWGKPSVWRVTGDRAGELWSLGSVHNLRQEIYPLPPDVDRLYQRADIVVIELDSQQENQQLKSAKAEQMGALLAWVTMLEGIQVAAI